MRPCDETVKKFCSEEDGRYATGLTADSSRRYDFGPNSWVGGAWPRTWKIFTVPCLRKYSHWSSPTLDFGTMPPNAASTLRELSPTKGENGSGN